MTKHYVNETGTELILDTGILIGSATEQHINFKKPDGVTGSFAASLFSSFSALADLTGTYLLKHSLDESDFDIPGEWKFQAYIGAIDGTWLGETAELTVFDNFQ